MLNFKDEYIRDMQHITPNAALLADTRELLLNPPGRTWGWGALSGLACAALVLALAVPFALWDKPADTPALLSADGSGESATAYQARSAMLPDVVELTAAELAELDGFADLLPATPTGMALSIATVSADGATLLVDYTDNTYDYLSVRVRPLTDKEARAAYPAADLTLALIEDCAFASDQGAEYLHILVSSGDKLLEYTAHSADMSVIWQAISAAKIFN